MTLLAGFNTLLHLYTGQVDFLVSTPISGRNYVESEDVLGLFSNTSSCAVTFQGTRRSCSCSFDPPTTLEAYSIKSCRLDKLVEAPVQFARSVERLWLR